MRISTWRQQMIERLIEEHGAYCHYCPRPVTLRIIIRERVRADDATIDHKIPRARGGTNDYSNLLLACSKCNSAKGDQSYEEFKADPRPRHIKERERVKQRTEANRAKPNPSWHLPKFGNGTLAAAIARGDIDEAGVYRKQPFDASAPLTQINRVQPLTYEENMCILKHGKAAKGWIRDLHAIEWPWLRDLVRPRVMQVGFGPWK